MPAFDEFLHYRSIDVSSVKELCRRWYPEPYNNRPRKSDMHRAAEDVTDSIAELRFYREHLFGDASRAAI
jgi:oligoribonuclease